MTLVNLKSISEKISPAFSRILVEAATKPLNNVVTKDIESDDYDGGSYGEVFCDECGRTTDTAYARCVCGVISYSSECPVCGDCHHIDDLDESMDCGVYCENCDEYYTINI